MVIACPNCKRKYQIDTTRIPAGGTSFTCWSCRAAVRVDPLAGLGRNAAVEDAGAAALPRPRLDETAPLAPATPATGPSTVPPAAMRFFESLAAEASLNKQMNAPDETAPLSSEVAAEVPPPAPEPVRHAGETLDLLTGNHVLDLPHLEPIATPPQAEEVLDLDLGIPEPPAREETLEFAPVATAPAEAPAEPVESPMRTQALASAPPELPSAAPRPRLVPTPIPLPSQYQELAAQPAPEPPPAAPPEPRPEPVRFRSQPIAPPPPPPADAQPAPFVPLPPPPPPALEPPATPAQIGQTAAEFATASPTAWVSPEVEPKSNSRGSRLGLLALVALVVVGVSAFLLWQFLLKDALTPRPPAAQTPPAPAGLPPAQQPAAQQPPAPTPDTKTPAPSPAATPPPAQTAAAAPTGSGGFTVQVRSSPSEADARAFADALKAGGFDAYVMRADLGSRGTWYRVRVGRFDSRDAARQAVGKLRSSGRANEAIVQAYEAP
jgi:septal ring-binding cell division protein DamX